MDTHSISRRRNFLLVAFVLIVVIVVLLVTWNQATQEPEDSLESPASKMPSVKIADKGASGVVDTFGSNPSRTNINALALTQGGASEELRQRIQREFRSASNLKSYFDKYSSAEYANNGAAQFYTSRALATCLLFLDLSSDQVINGLFTPQMRGNPEIQPRIQALTSLATRCSGFTGAATAKDMQARLNGAAKLLEPAALAAKLFDIEKSGMGDEALSIARQILRNPNGEIVDGLINYFTYRSQPWTIGESGEVAVRDLSADAWRLAACEWGADCGPTMPSLLEACWTQNLCQFASYQDYLQSARYSPLEFDKLLKLRITILNAVGTGNWGAIGLLPSRQTGK